MYINNYIIASVILLITFQVVYNCYQFVLLLYYHLHNILFIYDKNIFSDSYLENTCFPVELFVWSLTMDLLCLFLGQPRSRRESEEPDEPAHKTQHIVHVDIQRMDLFNRSLHRNCSTVLYV